MKKIFVLLAVLFLLSACGLDCKPQAQSKLGYRPTMKTEALDLQNKNREFDIIEFQSAEETLENLKAGTIDTALIGRKASGDEITEDIFERKLEEGAYTLISPQKTMVMEKDLPNLEISTCAPEEIKKHYPDLNLTFKNCDYQNGEIWLVSWDEYSDDFELLIPVNDSGEKLREYRSAFLYSYLQSPLQK